MNFLQLKNKTPHPPHTQVLAQVHWCSCRLLPQSVLPHRAFGACTGSQIPYTMWLQWEKCLYISYNKACEHSLGDECILPALNTNQSKHPSTDRLVSDQLVPALPGKGFLLLEEAGGEKGSPGHSAHCRAPSRNAASSHGLPRDLGTNPAARAAQMRLLLTPLKITGFAAHGQIVNGTFILIFKLGHKCLFFRECSRKPLPSAQMGTAKI